MCGIAGTFHWPDFRVDVRDMIGRLAHRGPDAEGIWSGGPLRGETASVQLGHRRLSFLDVSEASNCPFVKDGMVLVYNGEVYNFQELRSELQSAGVTFRTTGDTEVVLEAWRRWGQQSLRRLRGMFAFALYEEATGRLVLARDHFGIKPMFVTERDSGVAFASELKGLAPAIGRIEIDPDAVVASLMYYWVPEAHCAAKGVWKLPPGHWAEIRQGQKLQVHQYWDPTVDLRSDAHLTADDLLEIVRESVRMHLIADVPLSTFLSGGLDSSLITVLAKQMKPDVDAYTISFRAEDQRLEAMPDDLHYAKIIAAKHGIELHEIEIAPQIVDMLPKMVSMLDEPIGDAAAINTVLICTAARQAGVKGLLSGMGADELFGGYRKHYASLLAARYRRTPSFVRESMVAPLVRRLPVAIGDRGIKSTRWAQRFVSFASLPEEAAFRRSYTHYGRDEFQSLLSADLMPSVQKLFDEHAYIYEHTGFHDPVNKMCMTDVQMFMTGLNLTYTDRASMAASTEVRVPFIDIEVAKAAFTFSGRQKIDGRERKAILKKAAERVLPKEIIYRPKGLFSAPLRAWVKRDLAEMVDDMLPDGELVRRGMLQRSAIERLIREDRAGTADRSKEIWQLLTLEEWVRQVEHPADVPAH
jgi:asparagine synthase (glutamine-hydrolysing)